MRKGSGNFAWFGRLNNKKSGQVKDGIGRRKNP
jgi:hypothetical protein